MTGQTPDTTPDMTGHDMTAPPDLEAAPAPTSEQLPQEPQPAPEDLEAVKADRQAMLEMKGLADFPPPPGLEDDPEMLARVDELAPPPPQGLQDKDRERWALCSRVGAIVAIDQLDGEPEAELRKLAWSTARSVFGDEGMFPMDEPATAAA